MFFYPGYMQRERGRDRPPQTDRQTEAGGEGDMCFFIQGMLKERERDRPSQTDRQTGGEERLREIDKQGR